MMSYGFFPLALYRAANEGMMPLNAIVPSFNVTSLDRFGCLSMMCFFFARAIRRLAIELTSTFNPDSPASIAIWLYFSKIGPIASSVALVKSWRDSGRSSPTAFLCSHIFSIAVLALALYASCEVDFFPVLLRLGLTAFMNL